jgi:hypothetical protein
MASFIALMVALAAQLTPTPSRPQQFDLNCSGMTELQLYDELGRKITKNEPWKSMFRVDLESNRWCEGKCTEIFSPAIAKPDVIVMVQSDRAGIRQRTAFEANDGTMLVLQGGGTSVTPIRAKCTLQSFTQIPARAIKVGGTLDMSADPYPPSSH